MRVLQWVLLLPATKLLPQCNYRLPAVLNTKLVVVVAVAVVVVVRPNDHQTPTMTAPATTHTDD